MSSFSQAPANPFPAGQASQPNISNIITSLDPASLSQLLGAMSGNNVPQSTQPAPPTLNADLARLLAQVSSPVSTPGYGAPTQPPAQLSQLSQYPGLASFFNTQAQPAAAPPVQSNPQSGAHDMSEIMAQLAQYRSGTK
jgi:hypothetical protein